MNNTIYTDWQYEHLEQVCIENAIFPDIEEYGVTEMDFIEWLSDNGVEFGQVFLKARNIDGVLHYDTDTIEEYVEQYCQAQDSFSA